MQNWCQLVNKPITNVLVNCHFYIFDLWHGDLWHMKVCLLWIFHYINWKHVIYCIGIGSESPRTTMFNTYYNGIKRTLRDGCAGIPNLSHFILFIGLTFSSLRMIWNHFECMEKWYWNTKASKPNQTLLFQFKWFIHGQINTLMSRVYMILFEYLQWNSYIPTIYHIYKYMMNKYIHINRYDDKIKIQLTWKVPCCQHGSKNSPLKHNINIIENRLLYAGVQTGVLPILCSVQNWEVHIHFCWGHNAIK